MGFYVSRVLTISVLSVMAYGFISPVWSVDPASYRKRFCREGAVALDPTVCADGSFVDLSDRIPDDSKVEEDQSTDVDPAEELDFLLREMLCAGKDVSSQLSDLVNEIVSDYRESYEPSSDPNDIEFEAAVKQANDLITRNLGLQNLACLAEKGHRAAMMSLFVTYAYGLVGDNVNVFQSAKWFAKLLETAPNLQLSKALMYLVGFLTYEKDEKLALDLLIDGALKGDVEAQYFLGMLHINGKGGANKNDVVAGAWFVRAVQNDYQAAKPILINMPLCQ